MLSAAQLEFRRSGIGSSEISALAGVNPWASALDVWLEKKGLAERAENAAMRAGTRLEPVVLDMYREQTGAPVLSAAQVWPESTEGTLRHPRVPVALATPDGVVVAGGAPAWLVEAKAPGFRMARFWEEGPPPYYAVQAQWQCEVADLDCCDLVALIGGQEFRVHRIERDRELGAMLLELAESFWREHVEADVMPEPDGSEQARAYIQRLYPSAAAKLLPETPDAREWARRYDAARAAEAAAKAEKELAAQHLCLLIGEAEGVAGPGWKATWRPQAGGQPHWKAIAMELGADEALIAKHTPPGGRVLRVTWKDGA